MTSNLRECQWFKSGVMPGTIPAQKKLTVRMNLSWTDTQIRQLIVLDRSGNTISAMAKYFRRPEKIIRETLKRNRHVRHTV